MSVQTPDEWLLNHYDSGNARRARMGGVARPFFEIVNDHSRDECPEERACLQMSGEARWPEPRPIDDLRTFGSRFPGLTFREVMSTPLGEAA